MEVKTKFELGQKVYFISATENSARICEGKTARCILTMNADYGGSEVYCVEYYYEGRRECRVRAEELFGSVDEVLSAIKASVVNYPNSEITPF